MTDIEQILTREEQLEKLSEKQFELATQYRKARLDYASSLNYAKVELAKSIDIMMAKKKNVGIEMAEIMTIAKDIHTKDQWFIKACKKRDMSRAEYKGLAELIEAIKSQKMAILGIMKHSGDSERYGNEGNNKNIR